MNYLEKLKNEFPDGESLIDYMVLNFGTISEEADKGNRDAIVLRYTIHIVSHTLGLMGNSNREQDNEVRKYIHILLLETIYSYEKSLGLRE